MGYKLFTKTILFLCFLFPKTVTGYEKTLRKIVRNQSKMVPRPFSEGIAPIAWTSKLSGKNQINDAKLELSFMKTFAQAQKIHRPKVSTILSSVDATKGKSAYQKVYSYNKNPNELRITRNINSTSGHNKFSFDEQKVLYHGIKNNDTIAYNVTVDSRYYQIPPSNFFPPVEEYEMQDIEKSNSKEKSWNSIIIPYKQDSNSSLMVKGLFTANTEKNLPEHNESTGMATEVTGDKADFVLQGAPIDDKYYLYNLTISPFVCINKKESWADIDTQVKFSEFDIEPNWMSKGHYWDMIYESRYEALMRNVKWPALKVVLVPRTHVDSIWLKTFEEYHNRSVHQIISNVVKKLQFYKNLTFTWNEVSHLSYWWKSTNQKNRQAFKKLLKSGRLEITTGGWVETDEAITDLFGLVHLFVEGHEWLKHHLNYSPKVAWLTNTMAHSPTVTYILSSLDINYMVMTNVHYAWEQYLAEYQDSDFIWVQSWDNDKQSPTKLNNDLHSIGKDRYSKHSVLTHYLQFNSAGFEGCGPNKNICVNEFNFVQSNKNLDINSYNIKDKSELLLEQYSKTGTTTSQNTIIAPIGGKYAYETQSEFDYQYNNYEKIADFVNLNRGIYKATIEFGTPKDYFATIASKGSKYPTLKGDFINFADVTTGKPAYWVGYFTTRPFLKIMLRRLETTLRSTEILFAFACTYNVFKKYNLSQLTAELVDVRESTSRLLDRNVVSGTLPMYVLRHVHDEILRSVNKCWEIQEVTVSLLTSKPDVNTPYVQKYVYREGEFISTFKTIAPEDHIYLFNSLSHDRTEVIELITRHPNLRIIDHYKKDVTIQVNPMWKYSADNGIKISRRFYKITFVVVIPPMTLELFKIKSTYDATHNAGNIYCSSCIVDNYSSSSSIFPFNIHPVQTGDIQLESYKHRLIFDEMSGFLKTVVEKETNIVKNVLVDFGAFKDANVNSGMFLFNTNVTKPIHDILLPYRTGSKRKIVIITSGPIMTEITTVYGRLLQQTVRLYNLRQSALSNAIYVESKVDFEVSPKNRDLELFMSIQTDINNGQTPQIVTDNNGFQYTYRYLNISRRIESNVYPVTNMAFIEDRKKRLTYITDHAQGVTALQEGQLIVLLDRRVLFDDGRGINEGLADSSATCHRSFLLLENLEEKTESNFEYIVQQPSLNAIFLSNSLNYLQDIFVVDKHKTDLPYYSFMPMIKTSFPCDVSVINFRIILKESSSVYPNTALLILHRNSHSCKIPSHHLQCNGESSFSLDKIIRNLRAVFQTNLAGTTKGTPAFKFSLTNFPSMELKSFKIYF